MADPQEWEMKILWLGRTEDPVLKGLTVVMQIAAAIQDSRPDGVRSPKLVIRGVDRQNGAERAEELRLGAKVKKHAIQWSPFSTDPEEIRNEIRGASCLIMPSAIEPFGLVALEAIALGTPVIVSGRSGIGELLLTFRQKYKDDIRFDDDTVLEVDDDPVEAAKIWSIAIIHRLSDRLQAFKNADALRLGLRSKMCWESEIDELIRKVDEG
jgi:glycosyltransferase involved in cell wall biosynthesis